MPTLRKHRWLVQTAEHAFLRAAVNASNVHPQEAKSPGLHGFRKRVAAKSLKEEKKTANSQRCCGNAVLFVLEFTCNEREER